MTKEKKSASWNVDLGTLFSKRKTTKNDEGQIVPDNSEDNFLPGLPEVNLLPPRVKEQYAARDLGIKFIKGGVAIASVFALMYGASFVNTMVQDSRLQSIQAEITDINSEINTLSPYSSYRQQVEGKRNSLANALNGSVDSGKVTESFKKLAEDSGYDVQSYSLSVAGGGEAMSGSCVNPDPFTPSTGIGCITFSLTGKGNLDKLYNNFNKADNGFLNVYVPSTSNEGEDLSIDGSVSIDNTFIDNASADLALPIDQILNGDTEESSE